LNVRPRNALWRFAYRISAFGRRRHRGDEPTHRVPRDLAACNCRISRLRTTVASKDRDVRTNKGFAGSRRPARFATRARVRTVRTPTLRFLSGFLRRTVATQPLNPFAIRCRCRLFTPVVQRVAVSRDTIGYIRRRCSALQKRNHNPAPIPSTHRHRCFMPSEKIALDVRTVRYISSDRHTHTYTHIYMLPTNREVPSVRTYVWVQAAPRPIIFLAAFRLLAVSRTRRRPPTARWPLSGLRAAQATSAGRRRRRRRPLSLPQPSAPTATTGDAGGNGDDKGIV
jgi:hypothetical protein